MKINSVIRSLEKDSLSSKIIKIRGSLIFSYFSVVISLSWLFLMIEGADIEYFKLYIIYINDRYFSVQDIQIISIKELENELWKKI